MAMQVGGVFVGTFKGKFTSDDIMRLILNNLGSTAQGEVF
jgi:hypothetical protein